MTRTVEDAYSLTQKALALLKQPLVEQKQPLPRKIFISYCRDESDVLALLVQARLKDAIGQEPFLDMDIPPGLEWDTYVESKIRECRYFICLIGPTTLASPNVCKEIKWAIDAGAYIIPIWHNGFSYDEKTMHYDEWLTRFLHRNAITIKNEDAKAYQGAIREILSHLGGDTSS